MAITTCSSLNDRALYQRPDWGAALSLVLAPGGTAMFWVTQGACARAAGMSETAEINAPARTANNLRIVFSRRRRVSLARLYGNYDERPEDGQAWPP